MSEGEVSESSDMYHGAPPSLFRKARLLRAKQTKTEELLWDKIRNKKLGVKFRRQHPIADFIVDFYCHKFRLAIEIDGNYHEKPYQQQLDNNRDVVLEEIGIKVLRYRDEEILNHLDSVLINISYEISVSGPL